MLKNCIAIIPARGGSKRIPKKNIIDFFGKPMIAWTIQAALESQCFDKVLVSTDDEAIAAIAVKCGAKVPFLRESYADDFSSVSQAVTFSLKQAEHYWNTNYETVALLMPNCPLRDEKEIQIACSAFEKNERVSQISCFKFGWMNPWWSFKLNSDGSAEKVFPDMLQKRSQDLSDLFCPTGAIWLAKSGQLKKEESFYMTGHKFEPMSWFSALDIDDIDDLNMAKAVWLIKQQQDLILR